MRNLKSCALTIISQPISLKAVLECEDITKLMWDARSDNNALLHLFGVRLAGVVDLQLLDVAWRLARGERPASVSGLGWILEKTDRAGLSPAESAEMAAVKRAAQALFLPENGGGYAIWTLRPLPATLLQYCTDARTFFTLRAAYADAERAHAEALRAAVQRRLADSARAAFGSEPGSARRQIDPALASAVMARPQQR